MGARLPLDQRCFELEEEEKTSTEPWGFCEVMTAALAGWKPMLRSDRRRHHASWLGRNGCALTGVQAH
eukprot:g13518.t1